MMISIFDRVENIVGKGESAGYQHFLLFPQCFQKRYFSGWLNVEIVWQRVKTLAIHHFRHLGSPQVQVYQSYDSVISPFSG